MTNMTISQFYEGFKEFKDGLTSASSKVSEEAKMVLKRTDLSDSNLVQISEEITDACLALMPSIPEDTELKDIKMPNNEIWMFDKPIHRKSQFSKTQFNGISIAYVPKINEWQLFGLTAEKDHVCITQVMGLGPNYSIGFAKNVWTKEKYESDNEGIKVEQLDGWETTCYNSENLLRLFMAVMVWRESKVIIEESKPIERHTRKRLKLSKDRKYNYLLLRRIQTGDSTGERSGVKFTTRWIVSGHFRRQWYPSDAKHRLIFISPYIKGPEGFEIKEKVKTLIKVAR